MITRLTAERHLERGEPSLRDDVEPRTTGVISGGDLMCNKFTEFTRVDAHRGFIEAAIANVASR